MKLNLIPSEDQSKAEPCQSFKDCSSSWTPVRSRGVLRLMATTSFLMPTQRYAAGALSVFALHQAQIHQTHPLRLSSGEEESTEERDSVSDGPELWVHENKRELILQVLLEQNRGGEDLFLEQSVVELLFSGGSDSGPPVAGIGLRWRVGEALYGILGIEAELDQNKVKHLRLWIFECREPSHAAFCGLPRLHLDHFCGWIGHAGDWDFGCLGKILGCLAFLNRMEISWFGQSICLEDTVLVHGSDSDLLSWAIALPILPVCCYFQFLFSETRERESFGFSCQNLMEIRDLVAYCSASVFYYLPLFL